jgi:hypothetical protein
MGYLDGRFVLPPLETYEHVIENTRELKDSLFVLPAVTLAEQREERKATLNERCESVARLLSHDEPAVAWAHTNDEGNLLTKMIHGAVEIAGGDSDEYKEETFLAFAEGDIKKLVTKPKMGAFGLNWQHCGHMAFFPSHSFEQYYQGVRRCWRFGRTGPVRVDIVTTEGEQKVLENLKRKSEQCDRMFENLVTYMNDALAGRRSNYHSQETSLPTWL